MRIAVIGDGAMATVSAIILSENGHQVRLWSAFPEQAADLAAERVNRRFLPEGRLPDDVEVTADEGEAFGDVDLAISTVPTQYMRGVWKRLAGHVPAGLAVCSVAKGIENGTLLRPTEILADVVGAQRSLAALSGPCIAPEVARRLPASVSVAATDAPCAQAIQDAFTRPYFRVYTNRDLVGLELAGATKNVIAIAAGILDGMEAGDNAKAALLTRGLVEITRLGVSMGARPETFAGLAGMGDLVTTCISPVGRNRSFGQRLGSGQSAEEALAATHSVVEGVATTVSVVELAQQLDVEMPITQAVHGVVFRGMTPRAAIHELMSRPSKAESWAEFG